MRHLKDQIHKTMNPFKRRGAKQARNEEVQKILRFAQWANENGKRVESIENLGMNHVERFIRHLDEKGRSRQTRYKYFLSIKKLWEFSNKRGRFEVLSQKLFPENDLHTRKHH